MGNMISGVLGVGVFAAFTVGLAETIGTIPFSIIVGSVLLMVLYDLRDSIKEGFEDKKDKDA